MTRLASTVDRLAALVFGLVLIATGMGLLVWNTDLIAGTPDTIAAPEVVAIAESGWWPWAVAASGACLVVLAVRWLLAHTPKARVKVYRVGAGEHGAISADLGAVADAAARALQKSPDARAASGRAVIDRGRRTIDLDATAYSPATLQALIESIDAVNTQLAEVLGDTTIHSRTHIHLDRGKSRPRVE